MTLTGSSTLFQKASENSPPKYNKINGPDLIDLAVP
jgi:hypothetical protein